MYPNTVEHPYIHLNGNSGYSRHGDTVSLFADSIDNANDADVSSDNLALQLWACQTPYNGGNLEGWKLAEFQLGPLQANHQLASIKSDLQANFPESGDYAIAMVIAEWDGEGFNRVHDFHNYPNRDVFIHPRLEGSVGYYCVDERRVIVDVGRIYNPRDPDNSSGTLSLELWALPGPYTGGSFEGHALAGIKLGSLAGGEGWQDCAYDLEMAPPPAASYTRALMLREWVGNGYVTRDHTNFAYPLTFPIDTPEPDTAEMLAVDSARGQVGSSGQSTGQESATTLVEDVAETQKQAEPSQSKDTQQASGKTEADAVEAQVAPSEESGVRAAKTAVVEDVVEAEKQSESSQPDETQRASDITTADAAEAQVARSGQATGQPSESSVLEDEAGAEPQAEVSRPAETAQTGAALESEEIPTGDQSEATKGLGQRLLALLQKLKQWWRL